MTTTNLANERSALELPGTPNHHPRLAHHFDSMSQQFEAAKLGLWLFLATEVLLFGGLFVLFVIFKARNPEVFAWVKQHHYLNTNLGLTNTIVLIVSSMSMAMAVTYAQLGRRRSVTIALCITFLFGVVFMAIKSVEYQHKFHENLIPGIGFYKTPDHIDATGAGGGGDTLLNAGNATHGAALWKTTCRSCHGISGEGVEGQGKDIRASEFILDRTDSELIDFIKTGRKPTHPLNTTGILMPPKGGNPLLQDQDLQDIVSYIRNFMIAANPEETEPGEESSEPAPETETSTDETSAINSEVIASVIETDESKFWIPRSSIPLGPSGPTGLDLTVLPESADDKETTHSTGTAGPIHHTLDPDRPRNAHLFFGLYFLMTGLHGFHVLAGMGLIAWLIFRSSSHHFSPSYFTPIDLGGLYWHIVDIIWIFLFPMFYLM